VNKLSGRHLELRFKYRNPIQGPAPSFYQYCERVKPRIAADLFCSPHRTSNSTDKRGTHSVYRGTLYPFWPWLQRWDPELGPPGRGSGDCTPTVLLTMPRRSGLQVRSIPETLAGPVTTGNLTEYRTRVCVRATLALGGGDSSS